MPKILFICIHRPDRSPSQRFRFEQYLDYLKQNGFDHKISFLLNEKDDKIFYSPGKYLSKTRIVLQSIIKRLGEVIHPNADIIFVQREAIMIGTSFFERMFSKRRKLIYDFDDSLWIKQVSPANEAISFLKNSGKIKRIINTADLVIAGNKFLASYAASFNKNIVVIPTTIDTTIHKPSVKNASEKVCIGWTGSFSTIEHFKLALPFLCKIKDKYKERIWFKVIGDSGYKNKDLGIKEIQWNRQNEIEQLQEIDIGIMPLPQDDWARGKCGFKGIQYMSLGIPAIMTNVGVNKEIIEDGVNGFLAESDDEWIDKLSILIENKDRRKDMGNKGITTITEKYSVIANRELYLNCFLSLIDTAG